MPKDAKVHRSAVGEEGENRHPTEVTDAIPKEASLNRPSITSRWYLKAQLQYGASNQGEIWKKMYDVIGQIYCKLSGLRKQGSTL